jgi:hypothetical protein
MKNVIIALVFCTILSACATHTIQHSHKRSFSVISSTDGSSVIREPYTALGNVEIHFKSNSPVKLKLMKGSKLVLETPPTTEYSGSFIVLEKDRPLPAYFDYKFMSDQPTKVYVTTK